MFTLAPVGSEAWNTGWRMLYSLNRPDDVAEEVMGTTVGTRLLSRLFEISETAFQRGRPEHWGRRYHGH